MAVKLQQDGAAMSHALKLPNLQDFQPSPTCLLQNMYEPPMILQQSMIATPTKGPAKPYLLQVCLGLGLC